jgi:uncharacterized protein YbaA (DUF1428 family)
MAYIDGFIIPVPTKEKAAYLALSRSMRTLYAECGALRVVECWGDDVPEGTHTSFPMAVMLEEGETVVFSWVWWADKAARDAGNAKFMAHPSHKDGTFANMMFDGKRLIYGGFDVALDD